MHQVSRRHGIKHTWGNKQYRMRRVRRRHVRGLCAVAVCPLRAKNLFATAFRNVLCARQLHRPKRPRLLHAMPGRHIRAFTVSWLVRAVLVNDNQRHRTGDVLRHRRVL